MSVETNKRLVHQLYAEVQGRGNMVVADELLDPDYVEHLPFPIPGREGLKHLVIMVRIAFPDIHPTVDDTVAEGDKVAVRVTARGTHRGTFMGIAPTGKQVEWKEIHIYRIAGDKIVEHWGQIDQPGLLQQIGAIPAMG